MQGFYDTQILLSKSRLIYIIILKTFIAERKWVNYFLNPPLEVLIKHPLCMCDKIWAARVCVNEIESFTIRHKQILNREIFHYFMSVCWVAFLEAVQAITHRHLTSAFLERISYLMAFSKYVHKTARANKYCVNFICNYWLVAANNIYTFPHDKHACGCSEWKLLNHQNPRNH